MKETNQKQKSVWSATSALRKFPKLEKNMNTDVLIIGGGMAGILCAYMLDQAGVDYLLVEAETIGSGMTKNTIAKLTVQHGLIYQKLISRFGVEKAGLYYQANQEALKKYTELCAGMDCDFEEKDSYVYSLDHPQLIDNEMDALHKLNIPAEFESRTALPFPVAGAVRFAHQAQFHPLKFMQEIVKKLHIYEHTMVRKLQGNCAWTDSGTITADQIIVATHFPFLNRHGSYFLKMFQHRSYVIALDHAPDVNGMYVDEAEKGLSLRNYNGLLLIGGGDHRTGKKGGNWAELRQFADQYYPDAKERWHWAAQDCMTLDEIPYIGNYSKWTPNLYVATGFNKWGMTSSMVSAMLLADRIAGKENPYASVFSPSRSMLRLQLAVNAVEATKNLLTPTVPRCPHLGCALKWNETEHSWDCPCHGSRFDEDKQLINNPAMKHLK